MHIFVVGTGKLATELLRSLKVDNGDQVVPWQDRGPGVEKSVVIHAGSGRELGAATSYCADTQSPLIELATGSALESAQHSFPVVVCPNTNILMLKFMGMLAKSGHLFHNHHIELTESHQANKTSVPGTAVHMAHSLGLQDSDIHSVRQASAQRDVLQIPQEHLARHAFHRIRIQDGDCSLQFETRVYGDSAYADGVARIIAALRAHALENRSYSVMELVDRGWL